MVRSLLIAYYVEAVLVLQVFPKIQAVPFASYDRPLSHAGTRSLRREPFRNTLETGHNGCSTRYIQTCGGGSSLQLTRSEEASFASNAPPDLKLQDLVADHTRPVLTIDLMGGLGNQLFMIATLLTVADISGQRFHVALRNTQAVCCGRHTYWESIFRSLKPLLVDTFTSDGEKLAPEVVPSACKMSEDTTLWNTPNDDGKDTYAQRMLSKLVPQKDSCPVLMLEGYFQHTNYFSQHLPWLRRLFRQEAFEVRAREVLEELVGRKNMPSVVSVHYRIGDTANNGPGGGCMPPACENAGTDAYHLRAVEQAKRHISGPMVCLIFSDSPDAAWKESAHLEPSCDQRVAVPESVDDVTQFYLMSLVPYSIIEASTYSFWSALIATQKRVVIYPATCGFNMKPPNWISA